MPINLLSNQQFGFRQHRSTATYLCQVPNDLLTWTKASSQESFTWT